jgi:nucleotide-binding universal stress UspA family protein
MYYSIRTIVVGVDDLYEPDPVLAAAVALAERTGAVLHAVHAYEISRLIWDAYLEVGAESGGIQEEIGEANANALESAVARAAPSLKVHCHTRRGAPERIINEVARETDAELIVIGAAHHRALALPRLGTAPQRILRHAPTPVLVVRRPLPIRFERVLLTTDLSELSASVHEVGLDVVDGLSGGEPIEIESLVTVELPLGLPLRLSAEDLQRTNSVKLRKFLDERRSRTWKAQPRVRFGVPSSEILEEALEWSADLVVLGTHSRMGIARVWLGSVAEGVLRDLRCNALVVPLGVVDRLWLPVAAQSTTLQQISVV